MTQRHEDSDDDTYVSIGSAFEKLETVEDLEKAKRKKEKEHYVTDEQGRRRFHGAFTGGFSAGYFNTVGSKEGWAPSTFFSSKGKKSERVAQRPEDFMDAEDLGDYGIAPRGISAKESFSQKNETFPGVGLKREADLLRSVIPGTPALQNLVVPAQSTIGVTLLKAMGWKEGQGVGPKIAKYESTGVLNVGGAHSKKKVYGCSLPDQDEESGLMYPKEAEGFLFAPSDVTPWEVEGKDDLHGIGYQGIQDQGILGSRKATKSLYGMSGEAFGVGALEDDEEEEDNVYGEEVLTSYDSTLAAEGDITMERKFGWTGALQAGGWSMSSFKKSSKEISNTKKHPPPIVPRDFVCVHKFGASRVPPTPQSTTSVGQKPLSSTQRSQLLSDKPDSVFNLLSQSDRAKLKHTTEVLKSGGGGVKDSSSSEIKRSEKRNTEPSTAQQRPDIQSFSASEMKPFSGDVAKQVRYEAYLAGKNLQGVDSRMTEWERQKEKEEFSRVAKVFQPLASSLTSRFTRGGTEHTKKEEEGEKKKQPERPLTPESDPVQAAKANMFGILTREIQDWHPHRILCKRFNIPDPYPNSHVVGVASERRTATRSRDTNRNINFLHTQRILPDNDDKSAGIMQQNLEASERKMELKPPSVNDASGKEATTTSTTEVIVAKDESIQEVRPPMDLFKAIFAESSSENDSSDSETETSVDRNDENIPRMSGSDHPMEKKWQDLSHITKTLLPSIVTGSKQLGNKNLQTSANTKMPSEYQDKRDRVQGSRLATNRRDKVDDGDKNKGRVGNDLKGGQIPRRNDRGNEHHHGDRRDSKQNKREDVNERRKDYEREDRNERKRDSDKVQVPMEVSSVPAQTSNYGPSLPPDLDVAPTTVPLPTYTAAQNEDEEEAAEVAGPKKHRDHHHRHHHHKHKDTKSHKERKKHRHKHSRDSE